MSLQQPGEGLIQLVCSPIGNLGDITYRAVESLKKASIIACEDTRHSKRLLQHYEIEGKELVALHEHNETTFSTSLVDRILVDGLHLCLLSDAGCPGISDPGYRLVQAALEACVRVEVLPGPSAVTTALVGSGLAPDQFAFHGFLPVKSGRKEAALRQALDYSGTTIFFESPHRILKTLRLIDQLEPARRVCVARELTKKFETYHRGTAAELVVELDNGGNVKGEITLLIEGLTRKLKKSDRLKQKTSEH